MPYKLLVADDEAPLRALLQDAFSMLGYTCLLYTSRDARRRSPDFDCPAIKSGFFRQSRLSSLCGGQNRFYPRP